MDKFQVLQIQLLGNFRLVYRGELLRAISTRRMKSLLAFLLLYCDAPQSRQHLSFLFWPDSTEAQARNNLRQSLHLLRQSLPDVERFLQSDTQTIQWLPNSPFTLDVADFERTAQQADSINSLQDAVDLYHGELLPDCYDDWILVEREQLQQKFHAVLERLIRLLEEQGNYRSAIRYAERMLRSDPLREETYQQLIHLYVLSGNRTGATRVYQTCARVLKRELDLEPNLETQEIFKASQKTKVQPTTSGSSQGRTNNLPTYLTSFVGREAEVELLTRSQSSDRTPEFQERLLTFTGPGGCGKTRLAIQVASHLIEKFSAGVWFIDVATLADSNLIPHAIASALSIQDQPGRETLDTIIDHLRLRELLLIFDNCEYFVSSCARVVETLLLSCSRLRILATSQEKLNLPGERVWPVSPLSITEDHDLSVVGISQSEATRLFIERACSVLPTFVLNTDNAASIAQICQHLDGLPLAIELAAARVAVLTPAQIATRLDNIFHTQAPVSSSTPPRHQTLQATMDWSYELLSERERILFRRLSVFVGGFSLEAAEAVCADQEGRGGILTSEVLDLLSRLIDKSLVMVSDWAQGDQFRYRLLQPTWQYANEKLCTSNDQEQLRLWHLDYFLSLAEEAELHFARVEQGMWFDRLLAEHDNLIAAIDWSLRRSELTTALRLTATLWYYWLARGHYKEGLQYLTRTLELTKDAAPSRARAKALRSAGAIHLWSEGDWQRARPLLEEALMASKELDDKELIAGSLGTLGATAYIQGDYAAAKSFLTESLSLLSDAEHQHDIGWSFSYLGDLFLLQHDHLEAQKLYEKSVENFRATGDMNSLAYPIRRLGAIALERGDHQRAIAFFKESLTLNRDVNYQLGIVACLGALAGVAVRYGQSIRAAKLFGAAETLLINIAGKLFPIDQAEFDRTKAVLYNLIEEANLHVALDEGRAMRIEETLNYALKIGEI